MLLCTFVSRRGIVFDCRRDLTLGLLFLEVGAVVDLGHDLKADAADSRLVSVFLEDGLGFVGLQAGQGNLRGFVLLLSAIRSDEDQPLVGGSIDIGYV